MSSPHFPPTSSTDSQNIGEDTENKIKRYEITIRYLMDIFKGFEIIANLLIDLGFKATDFTVTEKLPTISRTYTIWTFTLQNEKKEELYRTKEKEIYDKIGALCDRSIILVNMY